MTPQERQKNYYARHLGIKREQYLRWKNKDPMRYEESKRRAREEKPFMAIFRSYFRKRLHRFLFGDNQYIKNKNKRCRQSARYKKENPAIVAAYNASRRAIELMAQPPWVDRKALATFYFEARKKSVMKNIAHEVDHIWPLQGKGFTGLHVPWNLRVITQLENSRKFNKRPDRIMQCQ